MDGSLRIGRIFGIPILLHWTFLLIIPLFAYIIGSQIDATTDMLREIFGIGIDHNHHHRGLHALDPRDDSRTRPLLRGARPRARPFARGPDKRHKDAEHHAPDVRRCRPDGRRDTGTHERNSPWHSPGRLRASSSGLSAAASCTSPREMTPDPALPGRTCLHFRVPRRCSTSSSLPST